MLQNFRHDFRIYRKSLIVQFHAAAALRGAFAMQILGMMVNNTAIIIAWVFFFGKFGTVNGWSVHELIGLNAIMMMVFGSMMLLSTGVLDLPKHVDQGSFDTFLTRPSSVLGQLASSNIDVTAFGDFILGVILTVWFVATSHASLLGILLFFISLMIACVVFWSFAILLPNIISFYVFDGDRLVRYFAYIFLDAALYPTGVLRGALRTILLVGLPSLFIGAVQVDILRGLHWELVAVGAALASFWLWFSLWLLKRSIRRYESANLVGAR